ncbi:hypothetical protein LCGC14_0421880 [marine sediment metagenome]|uniref:Uncharacterized protein n=1 Tax=marine sediment metagenome TaxID=412755 RepID=A0A0F9VZS1_9ZZZZ
MTRLILLAIALITLALTANSASAYESIQAQAKVPANICLINWEWATEGDLSFWRIPNASNALGTIDLRSRPQYEQKGGPPEGYALVSYDTSGLCVGPTMLVSLGSSLDRGLRPDEKIALEIGMGYELGAITSLTTRDALWEMFTTLSDPTGLTGPKPVRKESTGVVRLILGGYGDIHSESYKDDPIHVDNIIAVFQADYRRHKIDGITSLTSLQKWTGHTMKSIEETSASKVLPPEYVTDGSKDPSTTAGDTFVEAGDTDLSAHTATGPNGGFSWDDTITGAGGMTVIGASDDIDSDSNSTQAARAESDLSTDDMTVIFDWVADGGGTGNYQGALARHNSANREAYLGIYKLFDGWEVYRISTIGGYTQLGADLSAADVPDSTLQLKVDGSSIELFRDGVSQGTRTDTNITGNLRSGIEMSETGFTMDNFEAVDLGVAAPRRVIRLTKLYNDYLERHIQRIRELIKPS